MKKNYHNYLLISIVVILVIASCDQVSKVNVPPPPTTMVEVVVDTLHGVAIEDPYRWLEDQQSSETRAWIDTQNRYSSSILSSMPHLQELESRLNELLKIDHTNVPVIRGNRCFLEKQKANQDQYVIYKREGFDGQDEVLVDPHPMSEDHSTNVEITDISKDGSILVYGIRHGGQDETEIHLMDVDSRQDLPDMLERGNYSGIALTADNSGLYYSRFYTGEGPRVYYHRMGTDQSQDELLFGEGFPADQYIYVQLSEDRRYLVISVYVGISSRKTEIYYKDVTSNDPIRPLVNDIDGRFYSSAVNNKIFMQTDWEAPNGRILMADLKKPARKNWKEVVPNSDLVMESYSLIGGKVCVRYLDSVKCKASLYEPDGKKIGDIAFPNIGSVDYINGQWDNDQAFYNFSSFNLPTTVYRYNIKTGESVVWDQSNLLIDSEDIEVKQVWFSSKDDTKVPMFVVHKRGLKLDSSNPTLMTGYGGFNLNSTPYFSSYYLTWMEFGGVLVMVNLRGGGEFGQEWHDAAKFEKKQNTFDDFIAAGEWLVENKYTTPSKLAIRGGSNGGLLVGACMNQRPDLFGAVICTYPLLDMLRYHNLLMGPFWVSEYGSADDPDQFEYIYKYSPYHNVKEGTAFPAVLFITGDNDTRVDPMHARKMTALLQASNSSENPIIIRYETKAGHSGGRPTSQIIRESAEDLAFLFWQLSKTD